MNSFATSSSPAVSAQALDDKRVVKMVLESCQLLNNAIVLIHNDTTVGYKVTHQNHPCTKWLLQDNANYAWLVEHFDHLCHEYQLRYNKTHKCQQYLNLFYSYCISSPLDVKEFLNCTTNHKHIANVFEAYKAELNLKWDNDVRPATWYQSLELAPKWRLTPEGTSVLS